MKVLGWGAVFRLLICIVIGPTVLMSCYLTLSRWPLRWFTGASDWAALVLSVMVGVACIVRLPVPAAQRAVLALIYTMLSGFGLCMYSLYFVGIIFGDWL